ncbi:MAG: HAMP domain-containing histidine kinase [Ruminococcus sp.]|nr:HAMP domain-containing histidine kinase [Ruminococcus sp.]
MINSGKTLRLIDKMLEDGINGCFTESDYNETKLSQLESKWVRYLTISKQSQQKVEQDRKKLAELVSDISHQTKTPLSNIQLYTQLLEEQQLDEQSARLADEIRRQAEKLEFLIQSLIKTSRLETGTFQLTPVKNSISELISAAVSQERSSADKKGTELSADTSECFAMFDSKWTLEALCNIIDNAIKYTPEGGRVHISVSEFESFVRITVADTGCGIPENELSQIFGRFYRGSNVRSQDGVGIGLYLSRQIAEGQGGYITAASSPGRRSEFSLFLPKRH